MESAEDAPEVPVLLLGDEGVGKSTFLSRMTLSNRQLPPGQPLPQLRDLDQPFPFNVKFSKYRIRLEFYDTASPESYVLLKPAVIVLCYAIDNRQSLLGIQTTWKNIVETHFNYNESIPIILLGLKRDVRLKEDYDGTVKPLGDALNEGRQFVYPQEACQIAQEMRIDRYCECSAMTGELCHEVFEDISRSAALTLTRGGGRSIGTQCTIL